MERNNRGKGGNSAEQLMGGGRSQVRNADWPRLLILKNHLLDRPAGLEPPPSLHDSRSNLAVYFTLRALHLKRLSIDRFPRSLSNVTTIRINAGLSNLNRDKEEISGI